MTHCADATCGAVTTCPVCRAAAKSPAHRATVLARVGRTKPVARTKPAPIPPPPPCPHLGAATGATVGCRSCSGLVPLPTYRCGLHGLTVIGDRAPASDAVRACKWCPDRPRAAKPDPAGRMLAIPAPPPVTARPTRPGVVVTIAVGAEGRALHAASGPHQRRFAESIGADYLVLDDYDGPPGFPMGMKLGLARVFDAGWEWLIYADGDVLFRPGCVNPRALSGAASLGVFNELPWHRKRPTDPLEQNHAAFRAAMGFPARRLDWYVNAGVAYVHQSARQVLEMPPLFWVPPKGMANHCAEQDYANAVAYELHAAGELAIAFLPMEANTQTWINQHPETAPPEAVLHYSAGGAVRQSRVEDLAAMAAAHPWPDPPPPEPEPVAQPPEPDPRPPPSHRSPSPNPNPNRRRRSCRRPRTPSPPAAARPRPPAWPPAAG